MKTLLLIAFLILPATAGEIVTLEKGTVVYNSGPILNLSKSGSKLEQAEKIAVWIKEISEAVEKHGASVPATIALGLLDAEIERIAK